MTYRNIDVISNNGYIETDNLINYTGFEIRVKCFQDIEGSLNLMMFLIDYIFKSHKSIQDKETISYGLWLLKFVQAGDKFEIFELNDTFLDWREGADTAIYYLELQRKTCQIENVELEMPLFNQKIAVSHGVLEGKTVQGIRYPEPIHMSGWYLTTSEYNGDIKSMEVIDLQTLVVNRKDLIQFLALPNGFVFETYEENTYRIWRYSEISRDISGN